MPRGGHGHGGGHGGHIGGFHSGFNHGGMGSRGIGSSAVYGGTFHSYHHYYSGGRSRGNGGLGGTALPFLIPSITPETKMFRGNSSNIVISFNQITQQNRLLVKNLVLAVEGRTVRQPKTCCCILTLVAGGFCILPYFLFCCDCYRKSLQGVYENDQNDYVTIANIIRCCPNLETLSLYVKDNNLNDSKAKIIETAFNNSNVKMLSFTNCAPAYDFDQNNTFTNFDYKFASIKANVNITYSLTWGSKSFQAQNYKPTIVMNNDATSQFGMVPQNNTNLMSMQENVYNNTQNPYGNQQIYDRTQQF